jgi:hypothetical protein
MEHKYTYRVTLGMNLYSPDKLSEEEIRKIADIFGRRMFYDIDLVGSNGEEWQLKYIRLPFDLEPAPYKEEHRRLEGTKHEVFPEP